MFACVRACVRASVCVFELVCVCLCAEARQGQCALIVLQLAIQVLNPSGWENMALRDL